MGQTHLLGCLEKRDLLNEPVSSIEKLRKWGLTYEQAEAVHDAVDFYDKAGDVEGLNRILAQALEVGDTFLARKICRLTKRQLSREEWLALAERAKESGKMLFAEEAFVQAGEEGVRS